MALILNIETATDVCSVALAENGKVLSLREQHQGQSHARILTTFITECLAESRNKLSDLDGIAVSKGPGSFTGLRIGVATAKGLCYALDKPLISVNTMLSMASHYIQTFPMQSNLLLCPMIDARRMEVYTAVFNSQLEEVKLTCAEILNENSFSEFYKSHPIVFFGDGSHKFQEVIKKHPNIIFNDSVLPSASGMAQLSEVSYNSNQFEVTAYFEPYYLKDFYSQSRPG